MLLRARMRDLPAGLTTWWRANTKTVVVAALTAVVAGGAVFAVEEMRLRDDRIVARDVQVRIDTVLTAPDAALKTTAVTDGGTLTLVRSASTDSAVMMLRRAKSAGPFHVYQIWLIEGANARSVGLLGVDQTDVTLVIEDLRGMNALGVTIEDAVGAKSPTLPFVAEIALT
jgi:Anti-sigma-K factor rskA